MSRFVKRLMIIAWCLAASIALADEDVSRTVEASEDGLVTISNPVGSIDVKGWSREQVEVKGELGRNVEELVFERNGNEVKVLVKTRGESLRGSSSDLHIRVPSNSSLKVVGVSADITTSDVHGSQRLQTVSGDVDTYAFEEDIDIESVSGDIAVRGGGKELHATVGSVSGDIDVTRLSGTLAARSISGNIAISEGSFARAGVNTTSGDILFEAALAGKGRLDIETINGGVEVELRGKLSARFDIETFHGDIRNCFGPEAQRTSRYAPGRELVFTEGSGDGRVTIRTLNGDLSLCRN
ncbi:MAG: DUF4097 family beta strand repeat protein [Halioglobus sp.]|nr:DUF4097 family beta strand repeat protein [Halioglobus sp.]